MGPKHFASQNFSLFIVKFKKLGFSAPLIPLMSIEAPWDFWMFPNWKEVKRALLWKLMIMCKEKKKWWQTS